MPSNRAAVKAHCDPHEYARVRNSVTDWVMNDVGGAARKTITPALIDKLTNAICGASVTPLFEKTSTEEKPVIINGEKAVIRKPDMSVFCQTLSKDLVEAVKLISRHLSGDDSVGRADLQQNRRLLLNEFMRRHGLKDSNAREVRAKWTKDGRRFEHVLGGPYNNVPGGDHTCVMRRISDNKPVVISQPYHIDPSEEVKRANERGLTVKYVWNFPSWWNPESCYLVMWSKK